MVYHRTFDDETNVGSHREPEPEDCPECESDNTTYINCVDGKEIRKCLDCDTYFEIE